MPSRRGVRIAALAAAVLWAWPAAAAAEELDFHGRTEAGVRFYSLNPPGDVDGLTGWFDQYRYVHDKDAGPPTHIDLFDLQLGWYREDGTPFVRLERTSPSRLAERGRVDVAPEVLRASLDYHRFRTDDLRVFPIGTGDLDPGAPAYAAIHFSDAPADDPLGVGSRFYTQRTGLGGEVGLRLDDIGLDNPVLTGASFAVAYDRRQGARQDRFLLDPGGEADALEAFRSARRPFEQDVVRVDGQVVLEPFGWLTGVVDVGYEAFRENEDVLTLAGLAGEPAAETPITIPPGTSPLRAIGFVPDTDQVDASLRLSRRIRGTHVQAAGAVVHLTQADRRAPFSEALGVGDAELTFYTGQLSFDAPVDDWLDLGRLTEGLGVNGLLSVAHRDNGLDTDAFGVALAGDQVNFFLEERTEVRAELETSLAPVRGALVGVGYRVHSVSRSLVDQTDGAGPFIVDEVNFLQDESLRHTVYGRGRLRLAHGIRLAGEVGYESAPEVGLPRELEEVVYVEASAQGRVDAIFPITLSASGRVRSGTGDGVTVTSTTGAVDKDFERLDWRYALQATAQPLDEAAVFASFHHHRDRQEYAFLRTDFGRTASSGVPLTFFLDSRPEYLADTRSLVLGASHRPLERVGLSGSLAFTWVRVEYDGGTPTEALLEDNAGIDQKILSAEGIVSFAPSDRADFRLGYRFDRFSDGLDLSTLQLDEEAHTVTLSIVLPLGREGG